MNGLIEFVRSPEGQGLLAAGLGAAASSGRGRGLLGNLAHGGLHGLQAYTGTQDRQLELAQQAKRNEMFDLQLAQAKTAVQDDQQARQTAKQFFRPGLPGVMGDAQMPPELQTGAVPMPASQPSFDIKGYAQARMAQNPLEGMKLLQQLQKDTPINKLDVKDFTPASVEKFKQTGNYGDLVRMDKLHFADTGGAIAGLDPFTGRPVGTTPKTGNPFNDLILSDGQGGFRPNSPLVGAKASIARAGASNVSVTTKQEGEEAKAVGKFFGENFADIQKSGFNAQNSINRYDRLGQLLDGVDTGKFAPLGVEVAKMAQSVGLNIDPKLANKEAAVALSSEIALQLRNPSGGAGMPGAMSDADRNFLTGMVPGIEKTPQGRKLIIETAKKLAKRDMEVARMAREYRGKNGTINEGFYNELARHSEANPLFGKPAGGAQQSAGNAFHALPKAAQFKGKVAIDHQTGKRYRSDGMSWKEEK